MAFAPHAQHTLLQQRADESAASSAPSSPEPPLDDDGDFFPFQSNESQSSFGATSSRDSSMAPRTRQQIPKSPIEQLPAELLIAVFQKLNSPQDLYSCLRVSKQWANNCVDLLWHRPLFTSLDRLTTIAHATQNIGRSYWPYPDLIKRLNLATLNDINDGTMQPFNVCKRIERLTLTGCENLTDSSIIHLVQGNQNLLALDISALELVTDASINTLANSCPRLQGLNITGCSLVTDQSLVPLAKACRWLKRLKLNKCKLLTDQSIYAFAKHCPSMLEIDLQICDLVTDDSIISLLQSCKQLRELRLAGCSLITNTTFLALPHLKLDSLRILDLTACVEITDTAVERIIEMAPRLRILVLAKCSQITDRSVYAITKLGKNLHDIHLGRCENITDEALKDLIAKCNRIRYIDLAGCSRVTDASVKMLANLPKLRRIGLVKCVGITDASIRALARGSGQLASGRDSRSQVSISLERVHLSYCTQISLKGINELLKKCMKLTHLSLTGIQPFYTRDDLIAFCREAPQEFNEGQRNVFCVFSGEGVVKLREHLGSDPTLNEAELPEHDEDEDADDEEEGYGIAPGMNAGPTGNGHDFTPPNGTQGSQDDWQDDSMA